MFEQYILRSAGARFESEDGNYKHVVPPGPEETLVPPGPKEIKGGQLTALESMRSSNTMRSWFCSVIDLADDSQLEAAG